MENKQETLEEVAEKYANDWEEIHPKLDFEDMTPIAISKIDFIEGAKWQQVKMYSEEEVLYLLQKALTHKDDGEIGNLVTAQGEIRTANFFSWFEQFKKK